jgi:tryptophan-rich sensory protein
MSFKEILRLAVSLLLPLSAGWIGSVFTMPAIDGWYAELVKPTLNPPDFVFGTVWTLLYLLMGTALYLVWREGASVPRVNFAIGIFGFQLILNSLWSIVFFGLENPGGALLIVGLLWLSILANIFAFARISKLAAYLLIPYLLWVSFASYLNFEIWMLN